MATPEALSLSQPLTDFATAYQNGALIAPLVSPDITVTVLSGTFEKRLRRTGKSGQFSDVISADGTANEVSYDRDTDEFALVPRALKAYVTGLESNGSIVTALSPEEEKVNVLMSEIMLAHEMRVASVITNTSNYASGYQFAAGANSRPGAATKWSDWTNGDPIGDVKYMLRKLPSRANGTKRIAWCSDAVFDALCEHPAVLAKMGMDKGSATKEHILSIFRGLDDIVVSDLEKDTANEGATASFSRVWSATQFGIVSVPAGQPSTSSMMFAGTFRHSDGLKVRRWREEGRGYGGSEGVQVEHLALAAGSKVIQNDAGILLTSVL